MVCAVSAMPEDDDIEGVVNIDPPPVIDAVWVPGMIFGAVVEEAMSDAGIIEGGSMRFELDFDVFICFFCRSSSSRIFLCCSIFAADGLVNALAVDMLVNGFSSQSLELEISENRRCAKLLSNRGVL